MKSLAKRVRAARERAGLSQADVSERGGWHPSWISQVETGRREPDARNLALLAGVLGCRTDDLLPPERTRKK